MINICFFGDFKATFPARIRLSEDVKALLNASDVNVCNFESPIGDTEIKHRINNLILNQPIGSAEFIKNVGFNVVLLGNNHIMEHGAEEFIATLNAFSDVVAVGAGKPQEAYSVRTIDVKGKTLGFISCVHHEFGVIESPHSLDSYGAAWVNAQEWESIINDAKHNVDYLFVCPHVGVEHIFAPLPEWRSIYRRFIDWGADAVIGYHPHTPQGWEKYKGKPIFYSLGNFYFDYIGNRPTEYWDNGLSAIFQIDDNEIKWEAKPFIKKNGEILWDNSAKTMRHMKFLQQLIESESKYNDYIDMTCCKLFKMYRYYALRGIGGMSLKGGVMQVAKTTLAMLLDRRNERALLNMFQCESHRWVVERYLRNRILNQKL